MGHCAECLLASPRPCVLCDAPTSDTLADTLADTPVCAACQQDGDLSFPVRGIRVHRRIVLDADTGMVDGGTVVVEVVGPPCGLRATFVRRSWLARLGRRHAEPFARDVRVRGHSVDATTILAIPGARPLVHALVVRASRLHVAPGSLHFELRYTGYAGPNAVDDRGSGRLSSRSLCVAAAALAAHLRRAPR